MKNKITAVTVQTGTIKIDSEKVFVKGRHQYISKAPRVFNPGKFVYIVWLKCEELLGGIKENKPPLSPPNTIDIFKNKSLKINGKVWVEESLTGKDGIPTISAETARQILRESKIPNELKDYLYMAPRIWINSNDGFNENLSSFLRDNFIKKKKLERIDRYALARLLMCPLGKLEYTLWRIAFPQKFEV